MSGFFSRPGERGGALPVALAAVALLTFIGLVMLGIVREGFVQAHLAEETVRAELLAQKGLDEVRGLIRLETEKANAGGADYKSRVDKTQDALDHLTGWMDGRTADGLNGAYEIEVLDDRDNFAAFMANIDTIHDYPYSRVLTVRSTGRAAGGAGRSAALEQTVIVSTINPVFYYPLSAQKDIHLNGASSIVGDVLARTGFIHTSNAAHFIGLPGSAYSKKTDYPSFEGFYREGGAGPKPVKQFSKRMPFEDVRMQMDEDIDIASRVALMMDELQAALPPPNAGTNFGGIGSHALPANIAGPLKFEDQWIDVVSNTALAGDLAIRDGVLTVYPGAVFRVDGGSVYVRYPSPFSAAADLAGTVVLDAGEAMVVDGDVVMHEHFRFRGNLYVRGNLQVIGSVNVDGTIFVDGHADLKRAKVINDDPGWAEKPLILLVSGNLTFSDSRPDDEPVKLRAFFYSLENIQLYGVQTKLDIRGGVHGRDVTLNAVRESEARTDPTYDGGPLPGEREYWFTPTHEQLNLGPEYANLQIRYDDMIYLDPPVGIPVTEHVTIFFKKN